MHVYKYSLQEWLIAHAIVPARDDGDSVAIVYGTEIQGDTAWELWHLTDYVVTSVTGGAIWLVPRVSEHRLCL